MRVTNHLLGEIARSPLHQRDRSLVHGVVERHAAIPGLRPDERPRLHRGLRAKHVRPKCRRAKREGGSRWQEREGIRRLKKEAAFGS